MLDAKTLADAITITRALLAVLMACLGFMIGPQILPLAVVIMIVCWFGDFVDGGIARLAKHPRKNRIGESDLFFDTFVSFCLGAFLIGAGKFSWEVACWYGVICALVLWRLGPEHSLFMFVQAPIYASFIWIALRDAPVFGIWILVEIAIFLVINWHRFSSRVVPEFIGGMKTLWGRHGSPRHP